MEFGRDFPQLTFSDMLVKPMAAFRNSAGQNDSVSRRLCFLQCFFGYLNS